MPNLHFDPQPHPGAAVRIPYTTDVEKGRAYAMIFVLANAAGLFADLDDWNLEQMAEDAASLARIKAQLKAPDLDCNLRDPLRDQVENLHDNCRCLPEYRMFQVWREMAREGHVGAAIGLLTSSHYASQFIRDEAETGGSTLADMVGAAEVQPGELGAAVADFWKQK